MSLQQLYISLLAGCLVLLASIVATRVATSVGLPSLLVFLAVGIAVGEGGLGLHFDDAQLAQTLGTTALAVILVEGGLTTRFTDIRKVLAPAGVLATVGVGVSTVVTAVGSHLLLGIDWQLALLLGAIVSSTDAAAVFSVLRVVPLPRRVVGLLEAESGLNDAPAVILVLLFSTTHFAIAPGNIAATLLYQLTIGTAIGLACGVVGAVALRRIALPASGLYPLATFGLGMVAFAAAGSAQASGFIAAYLAGVVLANSGLPHRSATRSFAEGAGWLAQIGLFVLLGLLVSPSELPAQLLPAIGIGLVLLLLGRPLSVVASLTGFRVPWREHIFLSWAGLRGAVPIVLATFPIVADVPDSDRLLNIVFILVVVFTLVQSPSLRLVAHKLGLIPRDPTREIQVESAPLDVLEAELLTMTVSPHSRLHNVMVLELRLPDPSVITLIIRDGQTFVPQPETRIQVGDELLIVTTTKTREATERRLRAVGRRGKLAHWFDEYGEPDWPNGRDTLPRQHFRRTRSREGERMRTGIAGAGAVGRSVARELLDNGHKVLLIERDRSQYEPRTVPDAEWLLADACELASLQEAQLQICDVVITATGDDKVNLTAALLAKTEFGVPRVVARVNDSRNEWLFTEAWGVDVAVSTPFAIVAAVEEAIDVGHLVRLMTLRQGRAEVTKLTLPDHNPLVGQRVCDLVLPENSALVTVIRRDRIILPQSHHELQVGDEMLFVAGPSVDDQIRAIVLGAMPP